MMSDSSPLVTRARELLAKPHTVSHSELVVLVRDLVDEHERVSASRDRLVSELSAQVKAWSDKADQERAAHAEARALLAETLHSPLSTRVLHNIRAFLAESSNTGEGT